MNPYYYLECKFRSMDAFMQLNLHQTHHEIADFEGIFKYLTSTFQDGSHSGLHIFPELFLTGYPLQDLPLKKTFIDDYLAFLEDLSIWSERQLKSKSPLALLFGGLRYEFDGLGWPAQIENVMYILEPGKKLRPLYTKQLLPNYDLYEEKKYFTPGNQSVVFEFQGKNFGLLICEDMWFSHLHDVDPVELLSEQNKKCDMVINISASPYHLGKIETRINRALEISQFLEAPFVYVNRVGAEDEIIFDGHSFVVDGNSVVKMAYGFKSQILSLEMPVYQEPEKGNVRSYHSSTNSWSTIFSTRLSSDTLSLTPMGPKGCQEVLDALLLGIGDYITKNGMKKFTIALSGGMDSALVLTIIKLLQKTMPIELEAVFMPGFYSSSVSFDLSYDLCRNLGVKLTTMPIKFIHSTIKTAYRDNFGAELKGLADENIQSRLRGALIYMRSNDLNSVVLNTSNKSELSVGYSTIYGDSVGALSVLGDLFKSEVFELAHFINANYGGLIPEDIITRPPSAELRENQEDSQSLPPYDRLDPILEALLSSRFSPADLIKRGHDKDEVLKVYSLLSKSEYKRKQFCPIIKVKPKSFGFGHRVPISKKIL
ncbi:NAD(+) synthase [Bacteriovorax stolpii]|uniref:Glutamine-dependent NAD(+) synthetase n=2 Tax=Bacteriovorax stolpii TaxID=960 RepID=A0A2K9NT69_BACTC|nr:NAD(+) synthase [Bacteriovorax stolpii]QDK41294.1 NAD(+) synthase [Bacteriovorax stolpii]